MKKINLSVTTLLFCILSFNSFAQQLNAAKLDSFFNILSQNDKLMGSFAIAHNGNTIYQKTIGYKQTEAKKIAEPNTVYRIGSITKTFTATMIFQLIDEKKLTLETKLALFFPEIPNAQKISIANLLNHTSGLGDYVSDDLVWITNPHSKAELLTKIAKGKIHFEPGAKQQYSNSGYLLLSYILEKLDKRPYSAALKSRIISKLGLNNTLSAVPNYTLDNEARSYRYANGWTLSKDIYFPIVVGVGDILASPDQLNIFIQALLSGKLASAESLAKMSSFEGENSMAMGLIKMPFYDKWAIGHNGGTFGSYSAMYAIPEDGLAFSYSINGLNYNMNDVTIALLSAFYNKPYGLPSLYQFQLKSEDLDELLGNYSSPDIALKIKVTKNGSILVAQATGQSAFTLNAVSKDEFRFEAAGIVMKFDRTAHEMKLIQGGKTYQYVIEK